MRTIYIKSKVKMTQNTSKDFFFEPRMENLPFLIHGFGTGRWKNRDFSRRPEWKDFKMVFLNQVHSDIIRIIDSVPKEKIRGDAMITGLPFVLLFIKTADCLPVLIVDQVRKVVAAVHCGWKGTSKRILQSVTQTLKEHYGCRPSSLLVAMGPCVGHECYEVGEDVFRIFREEGHSGDFFRPHPLQRGKYFFDLKGANCSQLVSLGVDENNVFSIDICTHCDENFHSFRRDKSKSGRMLSFIGMSF